MKDEVFDIEFDYKGNHYKLKVKTDLPIGPEPFGTDYDIFLDRKHKYTINECRNEDNVNCWEVKKKPKDDDDPGFAQAIGRAINRYYS